MRHVGGFLSLVADQVVRVCAMRRRLVGLVRAVVHYVFAFYSNIVSVWPIFFNDI